MRLSVELNEKGGAYIYLAVHFYVTAQAFYVGFYQVQAYAPAFFTGVKPLVELKDIGPRLFQVEARTIVGKRNELAPFRPLTAFYM